MTTLVARDAEIGRLSSLLENANGGVSQIVFITGESGIGKTFLLESFIKLAKENNEKLFVAGSKCRNISGSQQEPYLPFVQIMEALLVERKDQPIFKSLKRGLAEVAPDWIGTIPVIGGFIAAGVRTAQWAAREFSSVSNPEDANPRLLQYMKALLLAADSNPLLLWIDDLHWSDSATLDLIGFLADHAQQARIMLIATYRPTDIAFEVNGQPHPVSKLVNKLRRYKQCSTIELTSFDLADLESYLEETGHFLPKEFKERLLRESGGNPLFIKEYLALLHVKRYFKRGQGKFVFAGSETAIEVPDTVRAVIEQRLSLIGKEHRDILWHASIQGEVFSSRIVAGLLDISEVQLLKELNQIEYEHKLIRETETRSATETTEYQFTPELVQKVLYARIGRGHKRQLHLAVARMLEQSFGNAKGVFAADVAVHYEKGERFAEAIKYYLEAARNALRVMAMSDAVTHVESAERLIDSIEQSRDKNKWQIDTILIRAEIDFFLAKHEMVLERCRQGELLSNNGDFNDEYAFLLYWRSRAQYALGQRGDSLIPVKQAIELIDGKTSDFRLLGHLLARLGLLYTVIPLDEAQAALERAYSIANEYNFPDLKALVLMRKGWIAINLLDAPDDAIEFGRKALSIAEAHDLIYIQIHTHRLIAYASRKLRKNEVALFHNEKAAEVAERSGLPRPMFNALYSLANSRKELDWNWNESLALMRQAMAITEKYQFSFSIFAFDLLSHLTIGLGLWSEAEDVHKIYESHIDESYLRALGFYHTQRGHLEYARGRYANAVDAYLEAHSTFVKHSVNERDLMMIGPFLGLAQAAYPSDANNIQAQLEKLKDYWKSRDDLLYSQTLHSIAKLLCHQGDYKAAEFYLREALESINGSMQGGPWPVWPYVVMDLGNVLLQLGELEEALEYTLFAHTRFSEIGHFLKGEASFILGKIQCKQNNFDQAVGLLNEAKGEWQRLGLVHNLFVLKEFVLESKLTL